MKKLKLTRRWKISFTRSGFRRGRRGDDTRINNEIRVLKVRLIDDEGNQLGVVDTRTAVAKAMDKGLDLVEVAPGVDPPVCRIMDYDKYRYEQEKRKKLARKKQHIVQVKEIRFKLRIEEHDYQVKIKHIKEFLEKKDKVRVSLRFRGREIAHKELGEGLFNRIANDVSAWGEIDSSPKLLGRTMLMTINPRKMELKHRENKEEKEDA